MKYTQLELAIKELAKINDGILNTKAQYQTNSATIDKGKWLREKGHGDFEEFINTLKTNNDALELKLETQTQDFENAINKVMDLRNKG